MEGWPHQGEQKPLVLDLALFPSLILRSYPLLAKPNWKPEDKGAFCCSPSTSASRVTEYGKEGQRMDSEWKRKSTQHNIAESIQNNSLKYSDSPMLPLLTFLLWEEIGWKFDVWDINLPTFLWKTVLFIFTPHLYKRIIYIIVLASVPLKLADTSLASLLFYLQRMIHYDFWICPHFYVTSELACCRFDPIISAIFMFDSHHYGLNELCGHLHW